MGDATSANDRLPWLDAVPPAKPARIALPRPATRSAKRHAWTPWLLFLGLFLAIAVAVIAFLAGRGNIPIAIAPRSSDSRPAVEPVRLPPPLVPAPGPLPAPIVIAPVEPVVVAPAPPAAAPRTAADKPRATRPKAKRNASARRPQRSQGVTVQRDNQPARATPPLYEWPAASLTVPSGRVVQLGAYVNGRQTMAAWRRLRRAYPYLATLPRKVTVVSAGVGRPHYYRLRIGAPSTSHARAICDNLHRIGRGCIVV